MSKICIHCGNVLKDNDYFCVQCCGLLEDPVKPKIVSTESPEKKTVTPPVKRKKAQKRPLNWMWLAGGAAAVVAVFTALIAVIALVIALFSGGPQTAVNNMENVMNGKESALRKMAPQQYWDYCEENNLFTFADVKDNWQSVTDKWNDEEKYGSKVKTSIEIQEKTEVSDEKLDAIADAMNQQYGIKKVKKAYMLDTVVTVEGKENSQQMETQLMAVKIGNKWYCVDYYTYGEDVYVTFNLYLK